MREIRLSGLMRGRVFPPYSTKRRSGPRRGCRLRGSARTSASRGIGCGPRAGKGGGGRGRSGRIARSVPRGLRLRPASRMSGQRSSMIFTTLPPRSIPSNTSGQATKRGPRLCSFIFGFFSYSLDVLSTNLDETYGDSSFFGVDVSSNIHYDKTLISPVVNRDRRNPVRQRIVLSATSR